MKKIILDVCCGGKFFWFDKKNPNVLFVDNRKREKGFLKERKNFEINPDLIADFRKLPLKDKLFKLVIWDPPHCIRKNQELGIITKKYGVLGPDWKNDLKKGFSECWRVLQNYGILVFKWNVREKKLSEILPLFKEKPLLGHPSGSQSKTHWLLFMKIEKK